jgi:hypothetical protein
MGTKIPGKDHTKWRLDANFQIICFYDYGNQFSKYGWQIDHIIPQTKGGANCLENLQPLHWLTNQSCGNRLNKKPNANWIKHALFLAQLSKAKEKEQEKEQEQETQTKHHHYYHCYNNKQQPQQTTTTYNTNIYNIRKKKQHCFPQVGETMLVKQTPLSHSIPARIVQVNTKKITVYWLYSHQTEEITYHPCLFKSMDHR